MKSKYIVLGLVLALALSIATAEAWVAFRTPVLAGSFSEISVARTPIITKTMTLGEYTITSMSHCRNSHIVEVLIISDSTKAVVFKVDNAVTSALMGGDSYTTSDKSELVVVDVMPDEGSEAIGADKVKITFTCEQGDMTAKTPLNRPSLG